MPPGTSAVCSTDDRHQRRYLIVNADDFGYFPAVSRGIIEAAGAGVVTATSVMANRSHLAAEIASLRALAPIDVGVHLNLTCGEPLTDTLRRRLPGGRFPGKLWWARRSLLGGDLRRWVTGEWQAQIEACRDYGVAIRFLNSHEHVHMLPGMMRIVRSLAASNEISFIRFAEPDWFFSAAPRHLVRNGLMQVLTTINAGQVDRGRTPRMLGLSVSGRLHLAYLERALARMRPGETAELMCHPGHVEPGLPANSPLRAYHDWDGELGLLTSPAFRGLLQRRGVSLIRYSDLLCDDVKPTPGVRCERD